MSAPKREGDEMKRLLASLVVAGLVASACASGPNVGKSSATPNPDSYVESPSAPIANAGFIDKDGRILGTAAFRESRLGVWVEVNVRDVLPGKHAMHIHAVGKCDGPDFTSAGGHFNPSAAKHGVAGSAHAHAGDLPHLVVGPDGRGAISFMAPHLSLNKAASNGLAFGAGTAIVIHASSDDEKTDPAGNSGARVACGIVRMNPGS
jgi:Cu-Zn family superoxide dismutase